MDASDYVDEALAVLGGEDAEFLVFTSVSENKIRLSCPLCPHWGYAVAQSPLWELVADARAHWEEKHRAGPGL